MPGTITQISEAGRLANASQQQAIDPQVSAWVSASAGTGKTKVLTERVLSLMLSGCPPQKILCLTFTKAAAAEMESRIFQYLGDWVILDDKELENRLAQILGMPPEAHHMTRARRLFAKVLETPGGMHIETIHAFCQSLLRRFPLEAQMSPHFTLVDERDAAELLDAAKEQILAAARSGKNEALADALKELTQHLHETGFPALLTALASARGRLRRLLTRHQGLAQTITATRALLGLDETETPESLFEAAVSDGAHNLLGLKLAAKILSGGLKTDKENGLKIQTWIDNSKRGTFAFENYADVFLTAKRGSGPIEIRKRLITKKLAEDHPNVAEILAEEADRLGRFLLRKRAAVTAQATAALLQFGNALLEAYQTQKAARALIDYDDLILESGHLLKRKNVAPWVLFKLDEGLDHILVDEAQDTSPDQWEVITALAEAFFDTQDGSGYARTVFAVGDLKQSIYSFQGADPDEFQRMRDRFSRAIPSAGQTWREVNLTVSFRSTEAVLEAVDTVFSGDPAANGVVLDGEAIRHMAFRSGHGGLVELWPPVEPQEIDTPPPWKPPVERIQGDSPTARLANLIAERVRRMIDDHELLESKGRPVRPGDVLILVRRRGPFIDEIVRALKTRNIGVAGTDRMILTQQIAVQDLMALGHFALLPDDDLTLAILLKSPLVGLDEDALFTLAHGRAGSLWSELTHRRTDSAAFTDAYQFLSGILARADFTTPFDFYSDLLDARQGRRKLLSRLGFDAADPVSEFLNLALVFERNHVPSLEGFLHWMETGEAEIKRDLEQARPDAVRVMTVHGAKGLESPIVFLPDTLQMPGKLPLFYWVADDNGSDRAILWPPRRSYFEKVAETQLEKVIEDRNQEYRRLLYVAMTRAEDRLYICGWHTKKKAPEGCWYDLMHSAILSIGEKRDDPFLAEMGETADNVVLSIRSPQRISINAKPLEKAMATVDLQDWMLLQPPEEPAPLSPLAPSQPDAPDPAVESPLSGDGGDRFKRGNIVHTLLQMMPQLPEDYRQAAAQAFLARETHRLSSRLQEEILTETIGVLKHPEFGALFGPGSRAEVPLVGEIGGHILSARIDRLLVADGKVMIVDYKTNRPPPLRPDDVPTVYLRQMAAYRAALQRIYQAHDIECLLLWTDGPTMMHLPASLLADHAP